MTDHRPDATPDAARHAPVPDRPAHVLEVSRLVVGYPGHEVIHDLTLAPITSGLTALVGPNAAGKTTLLRALAGLNRARGSLHLDGRDLIGSRLADHATHVAYMPQTLPARVGLTVFEALLGALKASPHDAGRGDARAVAVATLDRLGIADLALRPLDQLSGGQRQMASLAQAIARAPDVLLLDEPTSALDLNHQLRVMKVISSLARERGIIVIVVLHDIALACRWCDRVIVLAHGQVHADGPPATAVTPAMFATVYGVRARVEHCSHGFLQVMVDDIA